MFVHLEPGFECLDDLLFGSGAPALLHRGDLAGHQDVDCGAEAIEVAQKGRRSPLFLTRSYDFTGHVLLAFHKGVTVTFNNSVQHGESKPSNAGPLRRTPHQLGHLLRLLRRMFH